LSLDLDELRNQGVDLKDAKINLNIFRNYYKKEGDNQPDYRVYIKEKKEYNVVNKVESFEEQHSDEKIEKSMNGDFSDNEIPF
jgi:hypothetical protein